MSESPSDHSTISRTRRLIDVATHEAVFDWVLKRIGASGLLRGKTIGIDATTLEANAALRSIVRRDSEQGYEEFLMELAKASGIETPRREDLAKLDRKRTGKGSNRVWKHPHDAEARITRMKDGRTHLAHKAEQAVDLETGATLCASVRGHENVLKRLLIQVSAFNLGMLMRQSLGGGTPRGLQGRICALMLLILSLFKRLKGLFGLIPAAWPEKPNSATPSLLPSVGTT